MIKQGTDRVTVAGKTFPGGTKPSPCCAALMLTTSLADTAAFAAPAAKAASTSRSINSEVGGLFIPVSRSELVVVPQDIAEVIVADPDIADVHVIGAKRVAFIGKKIGRTNAKLFDKNNKVIRQFDVVVGYDLPAIRKALHFFLPREHIGVELVNTNIALTGEVSDASLPQTRPSGSWTSSAGVRCHRPSGSGADDQPENAHAEHGAEPHESHFWPAGHAACARGRNPAHGA